MRHQKGVQDDSKVSVRAETSLLMLTKLLQQLTHLIPVSPVFCVPGGPFQWCVAVSNSAQAKSTLPKSSTPKSSRPEVRKSKLSATLSLFRNVQEQRHRFIIIIIMCASQI